MYEELDKAIQKEEQMNDQDTLSLLEYLKHQYCDDRLINRMYLQYLKFLYRVSQDPVTRNGKIAILIYEVEEAIKRETFVV